MVKNKTAKIKICKFLTQNNTKYQGNMLSTDHPDIEYLKSPEIGKVLASGLAETFRVNPKFPVDFFAKWLLNYSREQKIKKQAQEKLATEADVKAKFDEFEDMKKRKEVAASKVEEEKTKQKETFADLIQNVNFEI